MSFQIVIDFGLLVLIWMVQLVVYPSFLFFDSPGLRRWHAKYTVMITIIVLPLMFGQVVFHAVSIWIAISIPQVMQVVFIVSAWWVTFFKAVPLHRGIDLGQHTAETIKSLIRWNWSRTVLWSLVFLIHFL